METPTEPAVPEPDEQNAAPGLPPAATPRLAQPIPITKPALKALPISPGKLILQGVRRTIDRAPGEPVLPLVLTLIVFGLMMATSFGHILYNVVTAKTAQSEILFEEWTDFDDAAQEQKLRKSLIRELAIVEGIDSLIIIIGALAIARPPKLGPTGTWPYAWMLAGPALMFVLAVNVGFAYVLRWLLTDGYDDNATRAIDIGWKQGWIAILLVCVQPAIIEELMFRHLLYGHLRPHVGLHFAVLLSSVVFGMAHLGNPVGWPVLIFCGMMLGYARAYSGNILLPALLHFFHNFFVLLLNHLMFKQ